MAKKDTSAQVSGYISKAMLKNIRVSPRKARLVVDLIRGRKVEQAISDLEHCQKDTAPAVKKLLLSAVANAQERSGIDVDELYIKQAWVDSGRVIKRIRPRAQGRAFFEKKRHSTIHVVLDEI